MNFLEEFELLVKSRYPLIYITSLEEGRLEYLLKLNARNSNYVTYCWDFISGYKDTPNDDGFAARNPLQSLELIDKLTSDTPAIFILKDFDAFLNDISVSRKLKNLSQTLKTQPKNIVIISSSINIPKGLNEIFTILEFPLPTSSEIRKELIRLLKTLQIKIEGELLERLIRACQGLSLERIRRVLSRIISTQGELNYDSLNIVLLEKQQIIRQTEILEFYNTDIEITDVGGLENLKAWLKNRSGCFSSKALEYKLEPPRGLLLIGVQGAGKSLTAKAIANDWNLPLLKVDIGRLFGGIVGESESRVRQMIQIAEALSPCVLWIDEIDKAFSGLNNNNDSGTTARVLATIITWLSEKTSPVFIVATANTIKTLPLELLRKGRFDEIFFLGLPNLKEREHIFKIHLSNLRNNTWKNYDIPALSSLTKEFSGAEIRQVIIEGMLSGFSEEREFTTQDIKKAISEFIPLACTEKEQIDALQEWAKSGKARLASDS